MKRLEVDIEATVGSLSLRASLDTREGALLVTGPNGSGKTSLLLSVLGVIKPAGGRVVLGDRVLFDSESGVDCLPEERRLGYVPQGSGLFSHMNARENVEFALACRVPGLARRARRVRALEWLSELGAVELAEKRTDRLSGGERQRVALARALASEPEALLLDEPFAALDVPAREQVRRHLAEFLRRRELPTLLVSHDAGDALAFGEHLAVVEAGRIVQAGRLVELEARPASPFVEKLLAALPRTLSR